MDISEVRKQMAQQQVTSPNWHDDQSLPALVHHHPSGRRCGEVNPLGFVRACEGDPFQDLFDLTTIAPSLRKISLQESVGQNLTTRQPP